MMENLAIPYLLQLKDAVNAIHLTETEASNVEIGNTVTLTEPTNIMFIPSSEPNLQQICIQPATQIVEKSVDNTMEVESQNILNGEVNVIYEVVYPEQLDLKIKPVYNLKRGRPKKKKVEEVPAEVEPAKIVKPAPRTRSGRVVKFPKHIEKDFKKVEIEDIPLDKEEPEFWTSEFITFVEDEVKDKTKQLQLEFHQRRRKISAQYRCPKCKKAYLGKNKMIQHIKKYPDHGPVPSNDLNFDVWNYLVDITQKCPPAQRGIKFCEELTNLLHNVLLLTSALFKKVERNKNHVDVDKVLGNAIGIPPGPYKFNESELYKDVTVLKLITNSDFFKPVARAEEESKKENTKLDNTTKLKTNEETKVTESSSVNTEEKSPKTNVEHVKGDNRELGLFFNSEQSKNNFVVSNNVENPVKINGTMNNYEKNNQNLDDRISVHSDLLSDNSLLNLPNLRNSVDELLSGVDSGTNLLDNSTSSDEVMNVDQFVNERFKKITEPEMEINDGPLNLDLPSLDLFQFHTS